MGLIIAIDFDDTFTADEHLWAAFIHSALKKSHTVYCVTSRRDSDNSLKEIKNRFSVHRIEIQVVFCNLKSKLQTMEDRGIKVNIWIDDAPHALVHGF